MTISLRLYHPSDAPALYHLFYETVHNINTLDYSQQQVEAWAPKDFVQDSWDKRVKNYTIIVAEDWDGPTGFAELDPNGHIDCFYVSHKKQGLGIGNMLLNRIEKEAIKLKISQLDAEVSITAKPFFERMGFKVQQKQTVKLRGNDFINYLMCKTISR